MLEEFRLVSRRVAGDVTKQPVTLTARERQVLSHVAEGATNKEIAAMLSISTHTVKSHMRKILAKLHMERRQEAAYYAQRQGLIPPPAED